MGSFIDASRWCIERATRGRLLRRGGWKLPPTASSSDTRADASAGAEIHALAARVEHLGLGIEHRQIAREPRAVALLGQS